MTDTVIGALSVKITADTQGVRDGIKATGKALDIGAKRLRNSANEWGKWSLAATTAAAAVATVLVKSNLAAIRELKNTAFAANTVVDEFQRGAFAAQQYGISTEKYGDILKDVNDRVGDFLISGAGPMVDFFEQIAPKVGITADAFKNLSGQDAMALYVKSLQDANVSQQEMIFFMEAMASDSTRLIPLFKDNAKQLNAMSKEAKALGIGLSALDVEKAELASKALAKSAATTDAMTKQLAVELAPIIVSVTELFTQMANNAGGATNFIAEGIDKVIGVVGVFADGLRGIEVIFKVLEVAAIGFSALAVSVFEGITRTIALSMDGWLMMVNDTIANINSVFDTGISPIPLASNSAFISGVKETGNAMRDLVSQTNSELHDLAMQQLPSEQLERFVADSRRAFEQVAVARVEADKKAEALEAERATGAGTKTSSEVAVFQAETVGLLEAMGMRFQSQEEMTLNNLARQREILNSDKAAGRITQIEFDTESENLTKQSEETKRQILVSNLQGGFAALTANSKKAQKFMKNVAIVQAVIKGKQAAVDAWQAGMSTGGPWAPLVAAGYAAASIANTASMISSIKSGGKSMSGSKGGGIPSVSTPGGSSASTATQQAPTASRNISINMTGSGLFSTDQVRELIEQINEQVGDGVQLSTGV